MKPIFSAWSLWNTLCRWGLSEAFPLCMKVNEWFCRKQNLDTLPNATEEFKSYHLSAQGDSLISVTSEPYYGLAHHRAFM